MKNLSLALNALLFILVGVLFYLHFSSSSKKSAGPQLIQTDGKSVAVPQIAYVDIDTFQAHYTFFKLKRSELEARQRSMEAELDRSISAFQSEYASLAQKAQTMTEEEGAAAQQKLMAKQQQIQDRKDKMESQFMQETQDFNMKLQERMIEYLKKYNSDGRYTYILPYMKETINILYVNEANNITDEVIKGMNEEYEKSKN
ncbi:MAG: OmpH family outer membrane protein [Sphingobacteriales bacterium]|nr:OmpH family outer membrane protein [Sphingobacteriales bacterium]